MRILFFWIDRVSARRIKRDLRNLEITADFTNEFVEAYEAISIRPYTLIIFTLSENDARWADSIKIITRDFPKIPILAVTSETEVQLIPNALAVGARDFLIKPFSITELKLRIERCSNHKENDLKKEEQRLEIGPLTLDLQTRDVKLKGQFVELTPRERCVLEALMSQNGATISKSRIAEQVFSHDETGTAQTIESYIHRLRKKVRHPDIEIATVRGHGYRLLPR